MGKNKKQQRTGSGQDEVILKQVEVQEELAAEELAFMQHKMSDEDRRREVIEGKTGQLLGQVSIVISIIALFIPLISDQLADFPRWAQIILVVLFLFVVLAYIVSIWIASTTWIINRYGYLRADLNDIYKCGKPISKADFATRHSALLQEAISQHVEINNGKGTKLIQAGLAFRFGTLILAVLIVCLSIALSVVKSKPKEIRLLNPKSIEVFR